MGRHNLLGKQGEEAACRHLELAGLRILERNWQGGGHEIDIIASDDYRIIFVEVKTRVYGSSFEPEAAVDIRKQEHLMRAANTYIRMRNIDLCPRFDVLAVLADNTGRFEFKHYEHAFLPPSRHARHKRPRKAASYENRRYIGKKPPGDSSIVEKQHKSPDR